MICAFAAAKRLLPPWIVWPGAVIALIGLISSADVLAPSVASISTTIPFTRFPALAWLIAAGIVLARRRRPGDAGPGQLERLSSA